MTIRKISLLCPHCGPFVLHIEEREPIIYRYCPACGERHVCHEAGLAYETVSMMAEEWVNFRKAGLTPTNTH